MDNHTKFNNVPQTFSSKTKAFFIKYMGDKAWIRAYWKVAIPAFLWSIFVSLAPIFATVFIASVLPHNMFGTTNATLNNVYNYNIYGFSYIDILAVVFVLAGFSIIGNYIAQNDLKKLNEIMKDILMFSIAISIIVTIFMTIYSQDFDKNLFGFSGSYLTYGSTFLAWSAVSIIFYMLDWYFISSFVCLNLIWVQCWSAIIGFIFYLIVLGAYSASVNASANTVDVARDYGIIYDFWYIVQILIIFLYCYIPQVYKLTFSNWQFHLSKERNVAYTYFYFLRTIKWTIDWPLVGFFFKYSYWVMLDAAIWAVADIFSQVGGVIDPHAGLDAQNQKIYHQIILLCSQYSTYLFIFFNGFGLITNIFLSIPLGRGLIKNAKENTTRMFWWGFIIALCLLFIVLIISYELNMYLIGGVNDPNKHWSFQLSVNGSLQTTTFTYRELWIMGMGMSCIYGAYMFINIMFNNIYYFQISGNSRLILLTDAFVSVVYAILTWGLILTHNNLDNLFAWYALNKSYVIWKLFIGIIVVAKDKSLNSVKDPGYITKDLKKIIDSIHHKEEVKQATEIKQEA